METARNVNAASHRQGFPTYFYQFLPSERRHFEGKLKRMLQSFKVFPRLSLKFRIK